jgi:DNA-binding MarR family transcriptional regulator
VRNAANRREVRCVLTAEGRARATTLHAAVSAVDEAAMAGLSDDQVRQLVGMLDHVRATHMMREGTAAPAAERGGDRGED